MTEAPNLMRSLMDSGVAATLVSLLDISLSIEMSIAVYSFKSDNFKVLCCSSLSLFALK